MKLHRPFEATATDETPSGMKPITDKSLESWIWDAACSIRGAQEAPKFKDFILPLIFTKRLCDVFDDELNRIAVEVGSRAKAFKLVEKDHKLVRFYLPLKPDDPNAPVWSVIRKLTGKIGESLTTYLHDIAKANPALEGIIDRMDFNATTHGQRDIDDDRLSNLIERISEKRLGLKDVEADIIGRSYEYLIRKFAEGSGQSAGEFFTPPEVARIMALIMDPEPGMSVYDPCCGSAGLLIACEHVLDEKMELRSKTKYAPLKMHGQEYVATTWAMANMNMIIHDMEGGDRDRRHLQESQVPRGQPPPDVRPRRLQSDVEPGLVQGRGLRCRRAGPLPAGSWVSRRAVGRLGLGAAHPRLTQHQWTGRDRARHRRRLPRQRQRQQEQGKSRPPVVRRTGPDRGVIYLPENLFYNTTAPGILLFLSRNKPKNRRGKFILVNASEVVEKGDPKNFIPPAGIERITTVFRAWQEEEKFAKVITCEQVAKEDYNISPSRYIRVADAETHRPIAEILEELEALDAEAGEANTALQSVLQRIEF